MSNKEYFASLDFPLKITHHLTCLFRHRRTLAIKRADAEPITREDLQYDFLNAIFDDKHAVFTNQTKRSSGDQTAEKLTFRDLYVNALINSPRSSKVLRDKMIDSQEFGTDFGKISLLTNVGRINTTMACALLKMFRRYTVLIITAKLPR